MLTRLSRSFLQTDPTQASPKGFPFPLAVTKTYISASSLDRLAILDTELLRAPLDNVNEI